MQIKPQRDNTSHFSQAKIKNGNNAKFWQNCREIGSLIAGRWMVQLFWKNVQQFHLNLNIHLPYNSAITLLVLILEKWKTYIHSKSVLEYS